MLETVRAKIIELVPEIVELKFGCWIKDCHNIEGKPFCGLFQLSNHLTYEKMEQYLSPGHWLEIIGRPITLDDILRSFQGIPAAPIAVSINGDFLNCDDDMTNLREVNVRWHLGKPLDQQPPETIEFLGKVLAL